MNISLESKVRIVFVFTFILLCFALFFVDKNQQFQNKKTIITQYEMLAKYIHRKRLPPPHLVKYMSQNGFLKVKNVHTLIAKIDKPFFRQRGLEIFTHQQDLYFHLITPRFKILFKDERNKLESNYLHFIAFSIIVLLLAFTYYLIMKNIKDTKLLLDSRQLFLRTVMHELKTPIAKGRIVSELIDDEKQKNRMAIIFDKLNYLINDFATVEELLSQNYKLNLQEYDIDKIITNSIDMLMLDKYEDKIDIEIKEDKKLIVDIDLISMAIKNLLDNALKYSNNKKAVVQYRDNTIYIISQGNKLSKPLEDYYKPFHNDTTSKNHGMGLGLYIVYSILNLHKYRLEYEYLENENIFKIKL